MFKRYFSFLHYCQLSCLYVMLKKRILSKPKRGKAQAVVRGGRAPPRSNGLDVQLIITSF